MFPQSQDGGGGVSSGILLEASQARRPQQKLISKRELYEVEVFCPEPQEKNNDLLFLFLLTKNQPPVPGLQKKG